MQIRKNRCSFIGFIFGPDPRVKPSIITVKVAHLKIIEVKGEALLHAVRPPPSSKANERGRMHETARYFLRKITESLPMWHFT